MIGWHILVLIVSFLAALCIGPKTGIEEQWKIFESLKGSGEVLFAIIGAWLAIVYPDVLKDLHTTKSLKEIRTERSRLFKLVYPALVSIASICLILFLQWLSPIVRGFSMLSQYKSLLRWASFFLLSFITLIQITAFFIAMIPLGQMDADTSYLAGVRHDEIERNKLVQKE